jgi:hypothetical protein
MENLQCCFPGELMSMHDSQQPAGPEPVEAAMTTDGSRQGDGCRAAAVGWQGYSPETLAALQDDPPPAVW